MMEFMTGEEVYFTDTVNMAIYKTKSRQIDTCPALWREGIYIEKLDGLSLSGKPEVFHKVVNETGKIEIVNVVRKKDNK
jgi:hypothetical protein